MTNYPKAWEAESVLPGAPGPVVGTQQEPRKSTLIKKATISQSFILESRPVTNLEQ